MKSAILTLVLSAGIGVSMAQVGDPAPDFTVTDVKGVEHNLYEYLEADKKVLIDFFYTTCIPCIYYAPQVNLAFENYGCNLHDVIFIAIDYDDTDQEVIAYDEAHDIEFPSVSGIDGGGNSVVSSYGITGFPTFYLIDSTKKIIDVIDPPTLAVFKNRFEGHGIPESDCTPTGYKDVDQTSGIKIYPIPAGEELWIKAPDAHAISVEIMDLSGRVVLQEQLDSVDNIDVSLLPVGTYTVVATQGESRSYHRLVIQR